MKIRSEAAARFGLNPGTVSQAISTLVQGRKVGEIYQEQKIFYVAVWGQPAERGRDLGSVAHNSTMLVSHYQHPEREEGTPALYRVFGRKAGAEPAAAGNPRESVVCKPNRPCSRLWRPVPPAVLCPAASLTRCRSLRYVLGHFLNPVFHALHQPHGRAGGTADSH